eukprot:scaffold14391_cov116-Isochrysis_galbana.AAC.1
MQPDRATRIRQQWHKTKTPRVKASLRLPVAAGPRAATPADAIPQPTHTTDAAAAPPARPVWRAGRNAGAERAAREPSAHLDLKSAGRMSIPSADEASRSRPSLSSSSARATSP